MFARRPDARLTHRPGRRQRRRIVCGVSNPSDYRSPDDQLHIPTFFHASWLPALACGLADRHAGRGADPLPSAELLSLGEIESRLTAQGITIKEIELRDLVVEIEGYDANGHEVELLVDRRSGEILRARSRRSSRRDAAPRRVGF